MTFEEWMGHKGLKPRSVESYSKAVSGSISRWAIDNGILAGPLSSITSRSHFELAAAAISALPVFQEFNERGNYMYSSALKQFAAYLAEGYDNNIESDIDSIVTDPSLPETEKSALITARIGQGRFRQQLIGLWGGCAVTGFKDPNLLVASHAKPWRASSHSERLDKFNGLLLIPNLDRAFDAGLITFTGSGSIQVSPQLPDPKKLGITRELRVLLAPEHEPYMDFHRSRVYRAA